MSEVVQWRSVAHSLLSILVLVLVASGSAAAEPASERANATVEAGPSVTTTVERVGSTDALLYELELDGLSAYDRVDLVVGRDATVVATDGLTTTSRDRRTWLQHTGDGDAATVRLRTRAATDDRPADDGEFFATESWLLGPVPLVELRWGGAGESLDRRQLLGDLRGASGPVTAGERYALVGAQHHETITAPGGVIRIVRPTGTRLGPSEDELAASLRDAAQRLNVGDRGDDVVLFALDGPVRRGGESFPALDEAWINADSPLADPNSVWLHEYVHTRQDFVLAADMQWFREASAEYYAARLAFEQDRISRAAMEAHLDGDPQRAVLTDPATWDDATAPYTKGARVVALLDRKIRLSTGGERSMEDVFRRLNAHDEPVTYTDFRDAVAAVAGHRMDGWLDRYVDGATPVAGFYPGGPRRAGVLGHLWTLLARWPLVERAGPGGVFLGVAVLLSGIGSVPLYRYLDRQEREDRTGRPA